MNDFGSSSHVGVSASQVPSITQWRASCPFKVKPSLQTNLLVAPGACWWWVVVVAAAEVEEVVKEMVEVMLLVNGDGGVKVRIEASLQVHM